MFEARYAGQCGSCRKPILPGQQVTAQPGPTGKRKKYFHVDCSAAPGPLELANFGEVELLKHDAATIRTIYRVAVKQGCPGGATTSVEQVRNLLVWAGAPQPQQPAQPQRTVIEPAQAPPAQVMKPVPTQTTAPSGLAAYDLDCAKPDANNVWSYVPRLVATSKSLLLHGIPGCGKTSLGFGVAKQLGKPFTQVTLSEEVSRYDLIGGWRMNEQGGMECGLGPMGIAFRDGHLLIIDEVIEANGDVQLVLYDVLNGEGLSRLTLPDGSVVERHPDFQAICTTNGTRDELREALADRLCRTVEIDKPSPQAIASLSPDLQATAKDVCGKTAGSRFISFRQLAAFDALRAENPAWPLDLVARITITDNPSNGASLARSLRLNNPKKKGTK